MPDARPSWRRGFDALERGAAGPLERAVGTGAFADALAIVMKTQRRVRTTAERHSRRFLHAWNLPAASDVSRLSRRIAELEREVRKLNDNTARNVSRDRTDQPGEARGPSYESSGRS
jgi:hypothetical protein